MRKIALILSICLSVFLATGFCNAKDAYKIGVLANAVVDGI